MASMSAWHLWEMVCTSFSSECPELNSAPARADTAARLPPPSTVPSTSAG